MRTYVKREGSSIARLTIFLYRRGTFVVAKRETRNANAFAMEKKATFLGVVLSH